MPLDCTHRGPIEEDATIQDTRRTKKGSRRRNVVPSIGTSHRCKRMDAWEMQEERMDNCMQEDALAWQVTVVGAIATFQHMTVASRMGRSTSMRSRIDQA